jgi:hypothetical protein
MDISICCPTRLLESSDENKFLLETVTFYAKKFYAREIHFPREYKTSGNVISYTKKLFKNSWVINRFHL